MNNEVPFTQIQSRMESRKGEKGNAANGWIEVSESRRERRSHHYKSSNFCRQEHCCARQRKSKNPRGIFPSFLPFSKSGKVPSDTWRGDAKAGAT